MIDDTETCARCGLIPDRIGGRAMTAVLLLTEAVALLRDFAEPQTSYGHFPGGDPREFSPDPECSTDEEREAHRLACEEWARAESEGRRLDDIPGPHIAIVDGVADVAPGERIDSGLITKDSGGRIVGHLTRAGFGLGTYSYVDENVARLVRNIDKLIAAAYGDEKSAPGPEAA